jgi:cation:H+ antiporter
VVGLALLLLGARWFTEGAVELARSFGVSELTIGLTVVAVGTSLPEVATSVLAALRGERDIAVGNAVGSNTFNLLSVLGAASVVAQGGVEVPRAALRFDFPVMVAVALVCLPIFFTGGRISRLEGGLLLVFYFAYVIFSVLAAREHASAPVFGAAVLWYGIPLAITGIGYSVAVALRERRAARRSA